MIFNLLGNLNNPILRDSEIMGSSLTNITNGCQNPENMYISNEDKVIKNYQKEYNLEFNPEQLRLLKLGYRLGFSQASPYYK